MGCGKSAFDDRFEKATIGKLERTFDKLEISPSLAKKFFREFEKIDVDHSGSINFEEFFMAMELEYSSFAERAFSIMDVESGSTSYHRLEFEEFFVGIYNYCTMDHDFLVKFAFDMFDSDGSGTIEKAEVYELVQMVYGKKDIDKRAKDVLKIIDGDKSGTIGIDEFREMEKKTRSLLFPIFNLQQMLCQKLFGESFWRQHTQIRLRKCGKQDIIEMHHQFYNNGKKVTRKDKKNEGAKVEEGTILENDVQILSDALDKEDMKKLVSEQNLPAKDRTVTAKVITIKNKKEQVRIYETRKFDDGTEWYLISDKDNQWVPSKFVKVHANADDEYSKKRAALEESLGPKKAKQKTANEIWKVAYDEETKRRYWYHVETLETQWEAPEGWVEEN